MEQNASWFQKLFFKLFKFFPMLKKLLFSFTLIVSIFFLSCEKSNDKNNDVKPETKNIIWDSACSGTATLKGRVELKNMDCGSKYVIYAVKQTKIGIYDSVSRRLIDTRFEILDEAKDRKKIIEQDAASNFSTTLEAGYYGIYAYPVACYGQTSRHWSISDTLLLCGGQVKDFGTVKF
jgi:hypothetical protein